jgi:hypothetical protein
VGGTTRSKKFTTLLLREVPFGERLRARVVEGKKPEKQENHSGTEGTEKHGDKP